ncbi:hypothetical protein KOM00_02005 [Geomonas sp. Red69]|uniref:hypothetical protein n=1 Tax=Geomonas diazotrophica TaxID=2843197 RepID=UPI001C11917A|nr:hypothetical protein [Geomonas diazotrophica]MBU5635500.1 hypothetical protein [Geomonas diazotrophica]
MSPPECIPGGFIKSWRKELDSDIWMMPPIYHRVWYWLRLHAQYEAFLFPTLHQYGIWVLPGQRLTSLQQIAEGVKWTEWGREVIPNKKTIKGVLDWLEHREMVTVESNSKGTLITIVNWTTYNPQALPEVTGDSNAEETRVGHKKERKERKEESSRGKSFVSPTEAEVGAYMVEVEFDGDPARFIDFYASKGWMIGRNKMKDWKAAVRTWKSNSASRYLAPATDEYSRPTKAQLEAII